VQQKKTIDLKCVVPIDMNYSTAICLPQSHEKCLENYENV
jgi:hypothetical protein